MAVDDASRKGDLATEPTKSEGAPAAVPAKRKLALAKPDPMARVPAEEKTKVVHIIRRLEEETSESRARKRNPWLFNSILLGILLPTVVAALFYLFIASDRFVSEARFAVRSNDNQAIDALGMITGMPSSQTVSDSYIVADYVAGRDMVRELERRLPLRAIYAKGDYVSRVSPTATFEDLVLYWQKHVDVYYDSTKNTVDVQVQAFNAVDADRIAREIVDIVRVMINDLSAQSRRDAVQFAASEVARAELRVRGARSDMLKFRLTHNDLDPTQTATATLTIAAQLEAQRSSLLSDLASVSGYLADDAPSVQMLKSRIAALGGEISRIQGQVSGGQDSSKAIVPAITPTPGTQAGPTASADPTENMIKIAKKDGLKPDALANVVGEYQELFLNQDFAEKAYAAAVASLDHARSEANRTQSYLAIFGQPAVAEDATYPRRGLNILIAFICASVLWSIGLLGALTVRDHIR
jgi:capsular polysaccharide transport system permease protein